MIKYGWFETLCFAYEDDDIVVGTGTGKYLLMILKIMR